MNTQDITTAITALVSEYIHNEGSYDDNTFLRVSVADPADMAIISGDELDDDADDDETQNYYSMLDLISMDPLHPGQWSPDAKAIAEVAASISEGEGAL